MDIEFIISNLPENQNIIIQQYNNKRDILIIINCNDICKYKYL